MADKQLATDTYVTTEDGGSVVLAAGTKESEMDDKVKERINNESAWAVSDEDQDEDEAPNYDSLDQQALMALVKERQLAPASNKKEDLVAALQQNDLRGSNDVVDDEDRLKTALAKPAQTKEQAKASQQAAKAEEAAAKAEAAKAEAAKAEAEAK